MISGNVCNVEELAKQVQSILPWLTEHLTNLFLIKTTKHSNKSVVKHKKVFITIILAETIKVSNFNIYIYQILNVKGIISGGKC